MSVEPAALLIFTAAGPILLLTTYPGAGDARLVERLRQRGIDKFLAYEVSLDAVRERYADTFDGVAADLEETEDVRVLDFNGHQIMSRFALCDLGEPLKIGD
jgi:hypothetical protein